MSIPVEIRITVKEGPASVKEETLRRLANVVGTDLLVKGFSVDTHPLIPANYANDVMVLSNPGVVVEFPLRKYHRDELAELILKSVEIGPLLLLAETLMREKLKRAPTVTEIGSLVEDFKRYYVKEETK